MRFSQKKLIPYLSQIDKVKRELEDLKSRLSERNKSENLGGRDFSRRKEKAATAKRLENNL